MGDHFAQSKHIINEKCNNYLVFASGDHPTQFDVDVWTTSGRHSLRLIINNIIIDY